MAKVGIPEALPSTQCGLDFEYDGRLTIMINYEAGRLEGVGFVKDFNTEVVAQYYEHINKKCDPVIAPLKVEVPKDPASNRTRSQSIPFTVKFEDGKTICGRNAQLTFIETLRHFGLEKVAKFNSESFKGYPLVGKKEYIAPDGHPRQKLVNGWWIYVNMPNWRKIRCINGIAKMLDVNVAVENINGSSRLPLELEPPLTKPKVDKKSKNARFSLNGSEPMAKNRSVLESVRRFIAQFPDATFEDIAEMFPKHLQGGYGVVRTIDDITVRSTKNKSESDRWFLDPSEILTAADGKRFAVSTEWGHQFPQFQKHLADAFGWLLEEV